VFTELRRLLLLPRTHKKCEEMNRRVKRFVNEPQRPTEAIRPRNKPSARWLDYHKKALLTQTSKH
jgi:hypothetical protein